MSEPAKRSPLIGDEQAVAGGPRVSAPGVILFERPFLGHLSLRGNSDDKEFITRASEALGAALPITPNTFAQTEAGIIAWMGPTEWLALCEAGACAALASRLREQLADTHSAVIDLSGGQTLIALQGEHALDVLAKSSTIDWHPRVTGAGRCMRTLLARTTAFVRVVEPGQSYEIVVRRSFADYLWRWLQDAGEEYGCQIEPPVNGLNSDTPRAAELPNQQIAAN